MEDGASATTATSATGFEEEVVTARRCTKYGALELTARSLLRLMSMSMCGKAARVAMEKIWPVFGFLLDPDL
jgi:hypothetical protein